MTTEPPEYDVCFILEGAYAFVSGGVSTWVHNLICGIPEIQFTAIFLLPSEKILGTNKYWEVHPSYKNRMPKNFHGINQENWRPLKEHVIFLYDFHDILRKKKKASPKIVKKQIELFKLFHKDIIFKKDYSGLDRLISIFQSSDEKGIRPWDIMYGKEAWEMVVEFYNPETNRESFIDYFWTFRHTHLPLFKILSTKMPKAKVYHTIATGYAGLTGVVASHMYNRPLLLTEHGLYTRERRIEIAQADWIYVAKGERIKVQKSLGSLQKIWMKLFESLGTMTYHRSDRIYTLYEGNREFQIASGAHPSKTSIIPNGIKIDKFSDLIKKRKPRKPNDPYIVGFVGRVVPIKDVKTFLRACKIVSHNIPNVKIYIMGSTDEDSKYFQECLEIVRMLRLQNEVEFTGVINVMEWYPKLDLNVLTSISEAQPLVILEANCAGVPSVASDVGSCRELIEGGCPEDKALGHSGIITRIGDPNDTAQAIIKILSDDDLRRRMAETGRKRVEKFYREDDLNRKYLSIYREFMER